jgi:hypothetical protein
MDNKRWTIILIVMLLIWSSIWLLFYLKADEVTWHPCNICAKQLGNKVICTFQDLKMFYYPNGSKDAFIPNQIDSIPILPK